MTLARALRLVELLAAGGAIVYVSRTLLGVWRLHRGSRALRRFRDRLVREDLGELERRRKNGTPRERRVNPWTN